MKITQDDMLGWVDGTLSAARRAQMQEHLRGNDEDAQLLADMKDAMSALHDWNAHDTIAANDNFWPHLREKLPERAGRGWNFSRLASRFFPARAWRLRAVVAVAMLFVALGALFLAPKNATQRLEAQESALSVSEQQFIRRSLVQHCTYAAVQPLGSMQAAPADGRNQDGDGNDDNDGGEYVPQ